VFATIGAAFGARIRQIPDGEVGERSDWITHLVRLFRDNPAFEESDEIFGIHSGSAQFRRYRLRPGLRPQDVVFGNLGYADVALASYDTFRRQRDAGTIAPGTRFQVDLAPAHSVLWLFVVEREQAPIDPVYNAALLRELDRILASIPHEDLAIQFDIASAVFARLERGAPSPYGRTNAEMIGRFSSIIAGLADRVPPAVTLLLHFCYGDANHKHSVEPTDTSNMVDMANALRGKLARRIDLLHMPVPRDRFDDSYFAPLRRLALAPETELCLGLVHYTDGIAGTRRRIDVARNHVRDFAVGTECGFGRRDPTTIPDLLRIHVAASDYA
jgi:hypothetical protein